ncbi:FadR/GntR family transcriptional regulator [Roseomonas sp. E05]|uniref:FadR/GntR family transcriptional regulator n=1 Tax=Roseomonas sp. E05 TaxID=3046310 RepID=UPI0024BB6B50|nr:FadR/GntR family transcriptional regulator [Roseomonas sp. E05]MDJ0391601.1 FadR/GntR family transcriptional regulator [Roseomonas sp. E05]
MLPATPPAPPRGFEIVARQIVALVQREHAVGQRLPAERELAKRFGVSRPTIREAILSLQMAGMLEVRKNSGAYVASLREAPEVRALSGFGPFENLQARQMIEPQIAALAAQHATPRQLADLATTLAEMRGQHARGEEADVADHRFHLLLAEASGNGVLVPIADQLWRGQIESGIWQEIHRYMPMAQYRPIWLRDHEAVFRAVEERRPRAAAMAMTRHLSNIRKALMTTTRPRSPPGAEGCA